MATDTLDNFEIITNALVQYGGPQTSAGEWKMVICPFHADRNPSCGVYIDRSESRRHLGDFNCLGCGEHGSWNTFAEKTGLDTIQEWRRDSGIHSVVTAAEEEGLLGNDGRLSIKAILMSMRCEEAQPWPEMIDWRGFKGTFLRSIGGMIVGDYHNDTVAALFPVRVGNKLRGAVKAVMEKKTTKSSYYTSGGSWIHSYGLFPYDYTKKLIHKGKHKFVVLVEGPRDALRLIRAGIPAIAVLGANTIGHIKVLSILALDVDMYYVMPDNDKGGTKLWHNLKSGITAKEAPVRRIKLPREYDKKGKLIKMDPYSAPAEIISNLKSILRERHSWRRYKGTVLD
jgi:5S rRNA maturation endonuclease (ribonuclease M5)